jgi:hypothetical protein
MQGTPGLWYDSEIRNYAQCKQRGDVQGKSAYVDVDKRATMNTWPENGLQVKQSDNKGTEHDKRSGQQL